MLDEIRSFFEELRKPFKWPENLSAIDPAAERELRAESERHWRLPTYIGSVGTFTVPTALHRPGGARAV
jgi:hypothetical protein